MRCVATAWNEPVLPRLSKAPRRGTSPKGAARAPDRPAGLALCRHRHFAHIAEELGWHKALRSGVAAPAPGPAGAACASSDGQKSPHSSYSETIGSYGRRYDCPAVGNGSPDGAACPARGQAPKNRSTPFEPRAADCLAPPQSGMATTRQPRKAGVHGDRPVGWNDAGGESPRNGPSGTGVSTVWTGRDRLRRSAQDG